MKRTIALTVPLFFIYGSTFVFALNMTPLRLPNLWYRLAIATVAGAALSSAMLILHKSGLDYLRRSRSQVLPKTYSSRTWYALSAICYLIALSMLILAQIVSAVSTSIAIGGVMGVMFGLGISCASIRRIERKLRDDARRAA